jgi:hypothetical protein
MMNVPPAIPTKTRCKMANLAPTSGAGANETSAGSGDGGSKSKRVKEIRAAFLLKRGLRMKCIIIVGSTPMTDHLSFSISVIPISYKSRRGAILNQIKRQ